LAGVRSSADGLFFLLVKQFLSSKFKPGILQKIGTAVPDRSSVNEGRQARSQGGGGGFEGVRSNPLTFSPSEKKIKDKQVKCPIIVSIENKNWVYYKDL
jgi:hypothetical protein